MRRLAFLLGCVHCAREAVAARLRAPVIGRFPETKVDARNSCAAARCAAAPTLRCLPRRSPSEDGDEGTRRPHPGQPLCPPGRRPRTGPYAEPQTRAGCSGLESRRRDTRAGYGLVTSLRTESSHVPSGPESWARVPSCDCLPPAGARTLAGRRTERPPRPPPAPPLREDAPDSRQSEPSARRRHHSAARFCCESPPLERPWPMGGRIFFRHRPDARASWVVGGPDAHADGWAREFSSGRLRAEGAVGSVVRAEAGRAVPGLVLPSTFAWKPRGCGLCGAWDSDGECCVSCVPLHGAPGRSETSAAGRGPACHSSGWRRASPQSASRCPAGSPNSPRMSEPSCGQGHADLCG